ncbi:hypothetical protein EMPS_06129 [Entomortierella parvispora]|uniref:Chromo domain-containing protein n=1 Tax=Entomortierella parvispora TaxID=205924 RepID=A0A9P3HBX6_9FUNG|nr:hypothetical protein EMPS_06129 [Entomortierella parvispora]
MSMTVVKQEPMDSSNAGGQGHSKDVKMETAESDDPFAQGEDEDMEDEGEDVFEVERVVGHSFNPILKTMRYFIKWKGYTTQDNTWEPDQAVFAHSLISEYWDRYTKWGGKKSDLEGRDPPPPSRKAVSKVPKAGHSKSAGSDSFFQELASSNRTVSQGKEQSSTWSVTPSTSTTSTAAPAVVPVVMSAGLPSAAPTVAPAIVPTVVPTIAPKVAIPVATPSVAPTVSATGTTASAIKINMGEKHTGSGESSLSVNPTKKARTASPNSASKDQVLDQEPYSPPFDLPSWEELVKQIDSVERRDGVLIAHLLWYNGKRSEHTNMVVRKKCPVKLVEFYESMLHFTEEQ